MCNTYIYKDASSNDAQVLIAVRLPFNFMMPLQVLGSCATSKGFLAASLPVLVECVSCAVYSGDVICVNCQVICRFVCKVVISRMFLHDRICDTVFMVLRN